MSPFAPVLTRAPGAFGCVTGADGAGGFPAWGIPAGATLLFEIELLKASGGQPMKSEV